MPVPLKPEGPVFRVASGRLRPWCAGCNRHLWHRAWRVNVAHDVAAGLQAATITPTKQRWDLALDHQLAVGQSIKLVDGKFGLVSVARLGSASATGGTSVTATNPLPPRPDLSR